MTIALLGTLHRVPQATPQSLGSCPPEQPGTGFSFPITPRYAEVDQQGVVFNGHYLIWFDESFTGFLDQAAINYPELIAAGYDVHVVHTELDFAAPVRWRDAVRVAVACEHVGTTSF